VLVFSTPGHVGITSCHKLTNTTLAGTNGLGLANAGAAEALPRIPPLSAVVVLQALVRVIGGGYITLTVCQSALSVPTPNTSRRKQSARHRQLSFSFDWPYHTAVSPRAYSEGITDTAKKLPRLASIPRANTQLARENDSQFSIQGDPFEVRIIRTHGNPVGSISSYHESSTIKFPIFYDHRRSHADASEAGPTLPSRLPARFIVLVPQGAVRPNTEQLQITLLKSDCRRC
jgi:hypothetical protein